MGNRVSLRHYPLVVSKVFYCGGGAGHVGMLRAVVKLSALIRLMTSLSAKFAGESFPILKEEYPPSTVVEVTPDETQPGWNAGFYRLNSEPVEFEELLRSLPS
jgi:hypothetical protein